jgi:hypothetical protein
MTFEQLCTIEPRLAQLADEVKLHAEAHRHDEHYCANANWFRRGFRDRVIRLAGWEAQDPRLRSTAAYDAACRHLYMLLPDCHDCQCFAMI